MKSKYLHGIEPMTDVKIHPRYTAEEARNDYSSSAKLVVEELGKIYAAIKEAASGGSNFLTWKNFPKEIAPLGTASKQFSKELGDPTKGFNSIVSTLRMDGYEIATFIDSYNRSIFNSLEEDNGTHSRHYIQVSWK